MFRPKPTTVPTATDEDDAPAMKSHDTLLKNAMSTIGLTTWQSLRQQANIGRDTLNHLRSGQADHIPLHTLQTIAHTLQTDLVTLLNDFSPITLETNSDHRYYDECQRLRHQLDTQAQQLTQQLQETVLHKLEPLLVQYPTLQQLTQQRPDLPATTVLRLLTSLENLLQDWQTETIGIPWQQVSYDPDLHQPDDDQIQAGDPVYIRFVGYRTPDQIITRAKVSLTLPTAAS